MAGDKVDLGTKFWYPDIEAQPGLPPDGPVDILTSLTQTLSVSLAQLSGGKATPSNLGSASSPLINGLTDFLNSQPEDAGDPENPKAYLNWILLDEQFKLVPTGSGFIPVAGFSANLRTLAQSNTTMPKNGYLIVYVSNETERRDVFFDNIVVQHYPGPLVEETHYYPFGLTMAGISSKAAGSLENKRKWNKGSELESKEFSDGSGLELYSTFYRSLDPQLGRFWQIDPKPNYDESLYAAMGNNPIMNTDFLGDSIAPGRTKGMNFFVTANKALRKQDIADYRPTKGILKGVRAFFSSAYAVDNLKARVKSVLGLGAMKVVTAGNAKEATDKIINKLGDNGYVKNLTIDYHADNFGPDAPPGSPTTLSSSTAELSRLAGGYAGDATTCYLGNCWGGGNPNIGLTGQDDYTGMISGALDGATVYGNQAAASSISFALSSHFIGVVPLPYGKSPANRSAVGKHTVTGRDPTTGATTTRTTTNMVRIANSGAIEEDY